MQIINPTKELELLRQQHFDRSGDTFSRAMRPVLTDDDQGNPRVLGSSILLTIDNNYYVISATHVFNQAINSKIYLPIKEKNKSVVDIFLNGFYSPPDQFDFFVSRLEREQADVLGVENFIHEVEIAEVNHSSENHFMAIGFPKSRNKVSVARLTLAGRLYRYIGKDIRKEKNFSYFLYRNVLHDAEKRIFDKPLDPDGMSGGMLLDLGFLSNWQAILQTGYDKKNVAKLLALITDKNTVKIDGQNILEIKAVDLHLIRNAIRNRYSD